MLDNWEKVGPLTRPRQSTTWMVLGAGEQYSWRHRLTGAPLDFVRGFDEAAGDRYANMFGLVVPANGQGDIVLEGRYFGAMPDEVREELSYWLGALTTKQLVWRAMATPWRNYEGDMLGMYVEVNRPTKKQLAEFT